MAFNLPTPFRSLACTDTSISVTDAEARARLARPATELSSCQTELMDDVDAYNFALLLLRCGAGAVMLAHGINHVRPTIDGTAGWFASMGMKPGKFHAWLASLTEIGCGILLILGLITPFAAAGIVGVMAVAWMINHRGNGFFIFRPGEGWEYVMTLGIVGIAIGALGPGEWSLDNAFDINDDLSGTTGLLIAAVGGIGGAIVLLVGFWRPPAKSSTD
jgi:putative oxidoreductase